MAKHDIEPDREKIRLDKLNASIARKQGLDRVASAIRNGFTSESEMIDDLALCKAKDLQFAIKTGFVIETATNSYELSGLPVTREIYLDPWLDLKDLSLLPEPRKPVSKSNKQLLIAPTLPGCKCRNADQPNPEYWLFTGNEAEIRLAASYLNELGIFAWPQENGINGKYKLLVPNWVTGNLTNYYEDLEEGENYVVYSIATAA